MSTTGPLCLNSSPGARAFYDHHRAAGDLHHQALRALGKPTRRQTGLSHSPLHFLRRRHTRAALSCNVTAGRLICHRSCRFRRMLRRARCSSAKRLVEVGVGGARLRGLVGVCERLAAARARRTRSRAPAPVDGVRRSHRRVALVVPLGQQCSLICPALAGQGERDDERGAVQGPHD